MKKLFQLKDGYINLMKIYKMATINRQKYAATPAKSQQGVTLIEAMIALLIFSVGALGLAAMQLTALSASGDSQQRSIAIWKAQEFADRIRSNPGLVANYVAAIGNNSPNTIGFDTPANIIACGQGAFAIPNPICADTPNADAAVCSDDEIVAYDVAEVFCEPNTGAAIAAAAGGQVANGSIGLTNLEVALFQSTVAGDDDMILALEWVSREADSNIDIANNQTIATDLCGIENININAKLDVYCLRFRP